MRRLSLCGTLGVIGSIMLVGGCDKPRGRVPVHTTTPAEREAPGMTTTDLASASDVVGQSLVRDMNRLINEEFVDPSVRVWVVFGSIDNKSGTMPRTDFEYLRERIKDKLHKSPIWRDNVKYVASRQQVEELNRREYGESAAPVKRAEMEHFYYLNGKAFGVHRDGTELYYVSFNLTRADDGAEVFSEKYEVKYGRI